MSQLCRYVQKTAVRSKHTAREPTWYPTGYWLFVAAEEWFALNFEADFQVVILFNSKHETTRWKGDWLSPGPPRGLQTTDYHTDTAKAKTRPGGFQL